MENTERSMLEDLLVAEILRMAAAMKAEKNTTSDCITESIKLIRHKRAEILRKLAQTQ